MIDLGDDEFTRGRPHPMFEPGVRDGPLAEALADPRVGIILLDIVLGYGGHPDPAGHLAAFLAGRDRRAVIVASVTGTDADPQPRNAQVETLAAAGVIVADSNAEATEAAIAALADPAAATWRRCGAPMMLTPTPTSSSRSCDQACWRRNSAGAMRARHVEAVFERSFYLRSGDDFICVGEPDIGNGPLTLIGHLRPLSDLALQPRQPVEVCDRHIVIGDSIRLTLDQSEAWRSPSWPVCPPPVRLIDTCAALERRAAIDAPEEGLARQVSGRLRETSGRQPPLARIARPRIATFERWLSGVLDARHAQGMASETPFKA